MKDLCVVKFKDGRYAIRKMDCDSDFRYLDRHAIFWWRYDSLEDFKERCTTNNKKEIFKRFDKIINNLEEESSVKVIKRVFLMIPS